MKYLCLSGLGVLTLLVSTQVGNLSALALSSSTAEVLIAQAASAKPELKLALVAEKRVLEKDAQGQEKVTWQPVGDRTAVKPGDVVRYTVSTNNLGNRAASNVVITQPIPKSTIYILNSASAITNGGAVITYSIDGGKSFIEKPTVQVKLADGRMETRPAPADAYTHVRWKLSQAIPSKAIAKVIYQVRVR
ncbi:hypothetical protein DO97_15240 [Neosynechococcus sphagnicola sy1]|uniref:DUF11 domain-containing protein n=1 Tax=Neosynechococcus sphagnicola sy1 TaxID=1497020 RepID=A0A098TN26_9CYAN|nr:DUF11 domain-containing protein [Neosynechococcus sphagnicola]KGF73656.1 hypothetical protein DO97_15240 [Neosynechococcus sphagnicola sy1]